MSSNNTPDRRTALVTGATSGIGAAFVRRLAADGYALVLVARSVDTLESQAEALRSAGTPVEVLPADLADRVALATVEARVGDLDRPIDLLVNNAGFGLKTPFLVSEVDAEQQMIDVMVTAVMRLSHAAATAMKQRGRGAIVTTSSVAGFLPGGSYSAAKAYATSFTEGLAAELRGTGVQAMALCPGFTRTEFHHRANINTSKLPGIAWLDADRLVADAIGDLAKGRTISVPGWQYKVVTTALDVLPRRLIRRMSRGGSPTKSRPAAPSANA